MLPGLIKATAGMDCSSKFITGCMCEWRLFFGPGWPFWTASFLLIVGSLCVSWQVAKLLGVLLSLFVIPGKPLRSFGPKGSWAVVTGASDGLGKEFALQLADADFNVVLVSRTASKLEALAEEIASKHPSAQTKIVAMDYAQNKDADFEQLKSVIAPLDVAVLVNNVGKSHDIPVPFALTPHEEMTDIVNINCHGTLRTTQLVIPGMAQRRRGLILTMGSFGGLTPNPLLATYSGSKAFLQQWSTSLGAELEPFGITVELVQAYLITSAMSKIRRTSMFIPNPRTFVKSVLSKITCHGGSPSYAFSSSPYWSHGLMAYFLTCVIGTNSKFLAEINMESHQETRQRALRKAEREKGKKLT